MVLLSLQTGNGQNRDSKCNLRKQIRSANRFSGRNSSSISIETKDSETSKNSNIAERLHCQTHGQVCHETERYVKRKATRRHRNSAREQVFSTRTLIITPISQQLPCHLIDMHLRCAGGRSFRPGTRSKSSSVQTDYNYSDSALRLDTQEPRPWKQAFSLQTCCPLMIKHTAKSLKNDCNSNTIRRRRLSGLAMLFDWTMDISLLSTKTLMYQLGRKCPIGRTRIPWRKVIRADLDGIEYNDCVTKLRNSPNCEIP